MKISVILVLLMIVGGIGAAYVTYQHGVATNDTTRNLILGAVNDIKQADNAMNTLILESRYGLTADYDEIATLTRALRQYTRVFTEGKLQQYADENGAIGQQLKVLNAQMLLKQELVESFKSHNAILRNSINYAPGLGERLIQEAEAGGHANALAQLKLVNNALYRWALYGDQKETDIITANANKLIDLHSVLDNQIALIRYNNHVSTVVKEQESTQRFIEKLLAITTQTTIRQLETEYLDHYVAVIQSSEKNLYYVFAYALAALAMAIYLGVTLKRTYSTLKERDDFRSQQIHVAYKHLSYADENVDMVKNTFHHIIEALQYLGGINYEAKKHNQDPKKMRALLARALKKYRTLERDKTFHQTDDLLDKSNKNLDRASELVKGLIVP